MTLYLVIFCGYNILNVREIILNRNVNCFLILYPSKILFRIEQNWEAQHSMLLVSAAQNLWEKCSQKRKNKSQAFDL